MKKYVYFFSQKKSEGSAELRNLLGGKGANLAQMAKLGLPVPPGFSISTEVCSYYYEHGQRYPRELRKQIENAILKVERERQQKFGDPADPLLFSVRSGARISMPGMMDTVLNLGLNEKITQGLLRVTSNPRFAWNSYWRFIFMFADVVMGAEKEELSEVLDALKRERNYKQDTELSAEDWKKIVERMRVKINHLTGQDVPEDPREQLMQAIGAVFQSWNNPRAITYRKLNKIPGEWGTAVNVQSMAFGNLGDDSGSGVGFTRNPSTGEKKLYGEFLQNAQGEDVVAGIRTPRPIDELKKAFPKCFQELLSISKVLERYFKDMQDIEFTIERGKLWMLQTRGGKRTARSAVKIALDMVSEGMISRKKALLRVEPKSLESFFRPSFDPKAKKNVIARGLAASPGAAVGEAVFDPTEAEKLAQEGRKVILVRNETSPDDIHGMAAAEGILTARGGMTSHAALVTRGMGKPCVAGCEAIYVDYGKQQFTAGENIIKKGDTISIDGQTGEVMLGEVPQIQSEAGGEIEKLLRWADGIRKLGVRTNADTPEQARQGRHLGAEGIGLCRTEHMFFEENRIPIFQEMILMADDEEKREAALDKILPLQKSDFLGIFKEMKGYPVIIRLLDPPLHEFLPKSEEEILRLSQRLGISGEAIKQKSEILKEMNPMMGHRGCRLGITYPELYEMQARAIIEAACDLQKQGHKVEPDIMVPLVMDLKEFAILKDKIAKVCEEVLAERKIKLAYKIGTMIELPRAALLAGEIAKEAEFFSFGTNDLTQTTLGVSRDDAGRFLPKYVEEKIFADDPFISLDIKGVGEMIKIGTERGRRARPKLSVGICGEHGGDPDSIIFSHFAGLDYVSCSPFRVPVARLAAAQAVLKNN